MATIKDFKIGKTSITIKNEETGKTKGVVKGITKYKDIQFSKQFDMFKRMKELNIWGNKMVNLDHVFIDGEEIIVIRSKSSVDFYEKYKDKLSDTEAKTFEEKNQFYEDLKNKVTVISCYL